MLNCICYLVIMQELILNCMPHCGEEISLSLGRKRHRSIIKQYSCGVRLTNFSLHCQLYSENIIVLCNLTFLMIFCLSRTQFGSDFCEDNDTIINQLMISIRRHLGGLHKYSLYADEFVEYTLFKFNLMEFSLTLSICSLQFPLLTLLRYIINFFLLHFWSFCLL